ncbi:MAG TPA: GlsB/YeaQ/YmgE family stress response membrane protein [Jiangellaceae bacterium]|nr:GlsB/YeaQ/YmgE family stress response membrane protein [Jiangellaceae bacterium]
MDLVDIIGLIIAGLVVGALGRLVVPGQQNVPIWLHLIVGVVAVWIGYWISGLLGVAETDGIDWLRWIISIIVAAIAVYLVARLRAGRTTT